MAVDDDDPPAPSSPTPPPPLRPAVRAFLSRKDVSRWVFRRTKQKLPRDDSEQVAQDALQECVEKARWPESDDPKVLWAVVKTVCRRRIADHLEQRRLRKQYEGSLPGPRLRQDPESGEYVPDEDASADPSHDPEAFDPRFEGFLLRRYLDSAVADDARDEETYGWLLASTDDELTYPQIAALAGVSAADVGKRVQRFKEKYLPRYKRWRNRTFLPLLLLGTVIAVVAIVAFLMLRKKPAPIRGADDFRFVPPASASASGSGPPPEPAPPPTLDNAFPTNPDDQEGRKK
jgi:DNA-directed RNA polymerase specialized sigma24 family protein